MPIRSVIFDVFGTLARISKTRYPYQRLIRSLRAQGLAVDAHQQRQIMSQMMPPSGIPDHLNSHLTLTQRKVFEADLQIELDSIELYPEVLDVIDLLQRSNLRVGLCSNLASPYSVRVRELLPFLDAVFSCEVGATKSDPIIYTQVLSRFGGSAADILFIGDSFTNDVKAPSAMGMGTALIDRQKGQTLVDVLATSPLAKSQGGPLSEVDLCRGQPKPDIEAQTLGSLSERDFIAESNQAYAADLAELEQAIATNDTETLERRHRESFGYHAAQLMLRSGRFAIPRSIKPVNAGAAKSGRFTPAPQMRGEITSSGEGEISLSTDTVITARHTAAGLRWLAKQRSHDRWRLDNDEIAILLGSISVVALQAWTDSAVAHDKVELPPSVAERIGLLLSIDSALRDIAPQGRPEAAIEGFSKPLSVKPFSGQSIRQYLLANPTNDAFLVVLSFLSAAPYS